ncbi:MAG TPA: hypothetical protein VK907_09200 [Phnomibacter sp.]|nr:hypothetical protein [Phnomibacter sp.]
MKIDLIIIRKQVLHYIRQWYLLIIALLNIASVRGQITSIVANANNIGSVQNVAVGVDALQAVSGPHNTAIGYYAARSATSGDGNTAAGTYALFSNTAGWWNSAMGYDALWNTTGMLNNAFGHMALREVKTGVEYVAFGTNAMRFTDANPEGNQSNLYHSLAVGTNALYTNTKGNMNLAVGTNSLYFNTVGSFNTGVGFEALYRNTTGNQNLAVGHRAMENNQTGSFNVTMGATALGSNVSGSNNVAFGVNAGYFCLGSGNVFYGYEAGYNETGSNKLYIGNRRDQTLIYGDFSTRQILLGVKNPLGYQFKGSRTLNVVGGILADSVRVTPMANWADHVFADDYPLMPLSELETFVRTHRHLPGIPTAAEVEAEGIEAGAFTAKLLEKIEELTLHTIAQHKELEAKKAALRRSEELLEKKRELLCLMESYKKKLEEKVSIHNGND